MIRIFRPSAERLEGSGVVDMAYPIVQDHELPSSVAEALRDAVGLVHRYPHGEDAVRETIAGYVGVEPENVLPTAGANGALDLVSRAWAAGETWVVPTPAFWQLVEAPVRHGARLIHPSLLSADFPSEMTRDFEHAAGALLCSPNNPLGQLFPRDVLEELLRASRGRPVVVDESYIDLLEPGAAHIEHDDLVLVRGFKTFLIPGVRAGYIVASADRVRQLAGLRPPFESSVFAESAISACLAELEALRRIWTRVREDLEYLEEGLRKLGGVVEPSRTVFTCWRHPAAREIGRGLVDQGIFTIFADRPVIFGMPTDRMRLTARRRDVTDHVLEAIEVLLESRAKS